MQEASVSMSVVISSAAAVLVFILGIVVALTRFAYETKNRSTDEQISALRTTIENDRRDRQQEKDAHAADVKRITERLHADELATTRLEGDLKVAANNHEKLVDDLEEIKDSMVTKVEFDAQMQNLNQGIARLHTKLDSPGRYSSSNTPRVPDPRRGGGSGPPNG